MNQGAFGPGKGAIGFDQLGGWKMDPTNPLSLGAPLVFTSSGSFRSTYGVVYEIMGCGGGGNGGGCPFAHGAGGAGFLFWWVGTGDVIPVTIGGIAGTTSFGTIATAAGNGGAAAGPTGGVYIPGNGGAAAAGGAGPFGLGSGGYNICGAGNASGYGGGAGGISAGGSGTPGIVIIKLSLPVFNSEGGSFVPAGATK